MGEKKDGIIGLVFIGIIIVIIVGVVLAVTGSGESKTGGKEITDASKSVERAAEPTTAYNPQTTLFDPAIVKSAKENIPKMQITVKKILSECENVKSYSDYQTLGLAMLSVSDELTKNADDVDEILAALVMMGYDKHPEVGPLIEETRGLYWEANQCMTKLAGKYGD